MNTEYSIREIMVKDFNSLGLRNSAFTLDIMANTGCSYSAACSAIAIWDALRCHDSDRMFDNGKAKRSVKIGVRQADDEIEWIATVK